MTEDEMSTQEEQSHINLGIIKAQKELETSIKLKPLGYCRYCLEDVDTPKLYCDDKCAKKHGK